MINNYHQAYEIFSIMDFKKNNYNIKLIKLNFAGADKLCSRLSEKINSSHNHKLILAHMPLLMVCLEVIFFQFHKFYVVVSYDIKFLGFRKVVYEIS